MWFCIVEMPITDLFMLEIMGKTAEEVSNSPHSDGQHEFSDHFDGVEGHTAGTSLLTCFMCFFLTQTIASASMNFVQPHIDAIMSGAEDKLPNPILK
jgi:hypothetical protein